MYKQICYIHVVIYFRKMVSEDFTEDKCFSKEFINLESKELKQDFTLKDCLNTTKLTEILGRKDDNYEEVIYMCNEFGIENCDAVVDYKNMAKKSQCYLKKLIQNQQNYENLQDLLDKLWMVKDCKYLCKSIKENEKGDFFQLKLFNKIKIKILKFIKEILDELRFQKSNKKEISLNIEDQLRDSILTNKMISPFEGHRGIYISVKDQIIYSILWIKNSFR